MGIFKEKAMYNIKSPIEIVRDLDKTVIGQKEAKEALACTFFKQMRAIKQFQALPVSDRLLLMGDTGSGKTFLLKQLKEIFKEDLKFVTVDCTTVSAEGWLGLNLSTAIKSVVQTYVNQNLYNGSTIDGLLSSDLFLLKLQQLLSKLVIVFDEFDKVADTLHSKNSDSSLCLQHNFLKLIEDGETTIFIGTTQFTVNLSNSIFIFLGAFEYLKNPEKELTRQEIGFNGTKLVDKRMATQKLLDYGLSGELVGRMAFIAELKKLDIDQLLSTDNTCKNLIQEFAAYDIDVEFTDNFYRELRQSLETNSIGYRGLYGILKQYFVKLYIYLGQIHHKKLVCNSLDGTPEITECKNYLT